MESNPLRLISNSCAQMRQLSQALQAARGNSATDVSDIFDISSSILSSILKETSDGIDPSEQIISNMKVINQMLASKEQAFKEKMNLLLNDTSQRVTQISDKLNDSHLSVNHVFDNVKKIKRDFLAKTEQKNKKILFEFQSKLNEEENSKKKEVKAAYENIESYLSQVMADITATYSQRLKQADELNDNLQIKLQDAVHEKHLHKTNGKDIFEEEERRVISERERITNEFNESKKLIEEKIFQLKQSIEKLKIELNKNINSNKEALKQKENEFVLKQNDLIKAKNDEFEKLENESKSLLLKKSKIESDINDTKMKLNESINQLIHQHDEKVREFRSATEQMKEKIFIEVEKDFKGQIDNILNEIKETEKQKDIQDGQFLQQQEEKMNEVEKDIQKMKEKNDEELSKIKEKLKEKRKELKSIQNQRDKDIEKVKNEKVKVLASEKQTKEEREKERKSIISDLLKKIDAAQKILLESKFFTIEELNERKSALVQRIESAFTNCETKNFDKIYEYEIELLREEFFSHRNQQISLKNRIQKLKDSIEILNAKIKKAEKLSIRALLKYFEINDESLEDDLKRAASLGSNVSGLSNLSNRLNESASKIEKKKNLLFEEADQINNSINSMHDSIDENLKEIEKNFNFELYQLKMKGSNLDDKKFSLMKKIEDQKNTIANLDKKIDQINIEIAAFQKSMNEAKMKFEKETKENFESDLSKTSQKLIDLQNETNNLRNNYKIEIDALKSNLENAKNKTDKISEICLKERQDKQSETNAKLLNLHNERMKKIENDHESEMKKQFDKLSNSQINQKKEIEKIESIFNQTVNSIEFQYQNQLNELNTQKQNFLNDGQKFDLEFEDLQKCPCQECQRKKELIKKLLQTKKKLEMQMEQHQDALQKNDQEMNNALGFKKVQVATPLLEMPKNQQHAPVIAKPGAAVNARAKSQLNQKPTSANSRFHPGVSSALSNPKKTPL